MDKSINRIHYFIAITILECVIYCFVSWCLGWPILLLLIGFDYLQFHALNGQILSDFNQLKHTSPINIDRIRALCIRPSLFIVVSIGSGSCAYFLPRPVDYCIYFFSILPQLMPSTSPFQ